MNKKIPVKIEKVLHEVRYELLKLYAGKLKALILFGSYARGDYSKGSDIDLALLLEKVSKITEERKTYFPIISNISLKHDTVISIIPFDEKEFYMKRTPLILNINKEGIKI